MYSYIFTACTPTCALSEPKVRRKAALFAVARHSPAEDMADGALQGWTDLGEVTAEQAAAFHPGHSASVPPATPISHTGIPANATTLPCAPAHAPSETPP